MADVAQEKGKWAITYDHPASCKVERCLTAPYWIWGPEYARIAEQVKAKTYKAGYEYFDADSKAMGLLGFMDGETPTKGVAELPAADLTMVTNTLAKSLAGQVTRFDTIAGPHKDKTDREDAAAEPQVVPTRPTRLTHAGPATGRTAGSSDDGGQALAHQTIEQGRFADIGPADDGDGKGHRNLKLNLTATV